MNKLLDSFLDLKCPFHGCNLQSLGEFLVCDKEHCNWHPARIERILIEQERFGGQKVKTFWVTEWWERFLKIKEYFDEQTTC